MILLKDIWRTGNNKKVEPNEVHLRCLKLLNNINSELSKSEGVYLIEFVGGGFYVGKSVNIARRIHSHLYEAEIGKSNSKLYQKIRKDGIFRICVLTSDQSKENYWIIRSIKNRSDKCYNTYIPKIKTN